MKRLTEYLLISSLFFGCLGTIAAQEKSQGMHQPPKLLNILREYTKPGKAGMSHEKTEAAFVQELTAAKWPTHYLAVDSMSGKPRTLFITAYDSFEAMEKDMKATEKNAPLSAKLDHAGVVDGELLSDVDASDFAYREDLSLHAGVDIPHMRYFEISLFHVKPGHDKDWEALVKMYQQGFEKTPEVHWAMYESVYGQADGTFIIFNPMKSATEIDHGFALGKQFEETLGEDGMKKLRELTASTVESSQTNLFSFNPRMSYVGEDFIKADPDFWKPKAATAAAQSRKEEKSEKKKE
jgi:hypothetical protein